MKQADMSPFSEQIVVGLGEVLWDCFGDSRRPGGAPANVAFHAQQLGHRGVICSRIGDDDLGHDLLEYLAARGLETRFVQRDDKRPTGRVTVDTTDRERPSYVIHENVAWDGLTFNDDLERLMGGASAVCFGTLAQRNPRSRETIHRALSVATKALVAYDVNLRQSWYQRDWIERSMRAARIVKLNMDEVGVLGNLLEASSAEPPAFADMLRDRFGVEITCITRADQGCLVIGPAGTADVPGRKVDVVDAVGAGDAFTAALISGCLRGWPLSTAANFANEVGALVAGRPGAMPVLRDDYADLVSRIEGGGVSRHRS
jgi:fructokinase